MELRQLRYFRAVAEELHFGRAARRLHISQPPLSQQILKLEEELGVRLLERSKHKVELTEPGKLMLARAKQMMADAEAAIVDVQRAGRGEIGHIEIGHSPSADLVVLPRIITQFRAERPDVELRLHVMNSSEQVAGLKTGRIQLGVVRMPMEAGDHQLLPVFQEPMLALLPTGHPLRTRREISLSDLANERMILFPRQNSPRYFDLVAEICWRGGLTLKVAQECESIQTVMSLVAMGLGVSLQPASVRQMKRTGVIFRSLDPPPMVEVGIAYMVQNKSRAMADFLRTARATFGVVVDATNEAAIPA